MEYSMKYVAPSGGVYEFLTGSDGQPFIELDTIEGLVGTFEDTPIQVVGETGARVDLRDRVIHRLEGTFTVVVFSREQWAGLVRDFSTTTPGVLVLDVGGVGFELRVKLATPLPFPTVVPQAGVRITVSVIADAGVWECPVSSEGTVEVANFGDVPAWPEITWSGAGGVAVLPSGASFTLPAVETEHVLPLARSASGVAHDARGRRLRVDEVVSEMVPAGETRTFVVPAGARLITRVGVLNPWAS